MPAATAVSRDSVLSAAMSLVEKVFERCIVRDYAVRFWDGSIWHPVGATMPPRFTIVLHHPGALHNLLSGSDLAAGEAYIYGGIDIEGDVEASFNLADALLRSDWRLTEKLCLAQLMSYLPAWRPPGGVQNLPHLSGAGHSPNRDRLAVTYHYDISNDFYRLWLDSEMVYSCGYFKSRADDLETAQANKLDYICRKLRLRPGERLLDLGCGWGALIMHAASKYGVQALGITLSRAQAEFATTRIQHLGLDRQCRVEVRDYRDLGDVGYDKAVSVGMFEHVGEDMLPRYFECAFRLLRAGGIFLNHGIARAAASGRRKHPTFISTYVFPDGELVPINTTLHAAESAGFEIRDVESLREHYALTLRHWVDRLEKREAEARCIVGDVIFRIFRLYTAGAAHWFATGRNNIYQVVMAKPDGGTCNLPLSRTDWYADPVR